MGHPEWFCGLPDFAIYNRHYGVAPVGNLRRLKNVPLNERFRLARGVASAACVPTELRNVCSQVGWAGSGG